MYALIPICPETLEMIETLNGGVRPLFSEDSESWFLYKGENEPAEIIGPDDDRTSPVWWKHIFVIYCDQP